MTRNTPIPKLAPEDQDWVRRLVVHEDAALLVFNKPSGLPVQTRGNRGKTLDHLLWAFAKSNGKRPHLVHRLDSGTSGLIIAGRTKPAIAALSEAFASRDVKKTYLAAVAGRPKKDAGTCSGRIVKAGRKVSVTAKPDTGDRSRTDWSLIPPSTETHTLLMAIPYTGRMHQIRAHFADMNCPIVGDTLYGAAAERVDNAVHRAVNRGVDSAVDNASDAECRLMLHAWRLDVPHPNGGRLVLEAPLPDDFQKGLEALGLQLPPGNV